MAGQYVSWSLNNADTTSASVSFSPGGTWTAPDGSSESYSQGNAEEGIQVKVSYGSISWSWTFSDGGSSSSKSPSHTYTGLGPGRKNWCGVTVQATCTRTETTKTWWTETETQQKPAGKDEDGNTIYEEVEVDKTYSNTASDKTTVEIGQASTDVYVYTKPSAFTRNSGITVDGIIQASNGLTASSWNSFVTKVEEYTNWKKQASGANYSSAEVESGELITAAKYNILANALGISTVKVGQLITAQVFINLFNGIN